MMPLNSASCRPMAQGLGKMNSETSKAEQMTCHSRMTASSSTQGAQRSAYFLCM